ncbi:uncharacterized protein LOC122931660 [Bufo gargarizans]|uniref:uncharacterized protein LOC122931660 n=1 Tax=Bufo gargarizans TaxID=30331 RepID=UPI001CF0FBAD|nr:uncharacterized protein LOC122931660 [Bufo gargarizans]
MPKWNVDKLIILVQERPELWDTRSSAYQDRVRKEISWEKVARRLKPREWDKEDNRGRAELVKNVKVRWNSCRDQFRRELNEKGRSGEGTSKKRPYIYTQQLSFLRPVMELRPTVDNLEESEDSDVGGEETPAFFSPESSPQHSPAVETTEQPMATSGGEPERPQPRQQPRRRRNARQSSSELATREMIDARVIQFLAQRRTNGHEEIMLRGLAPMLKLVPQASQQQCVASLALVLKMFSLPYQRDILFDINHLLQKYMVASNQQPPSFQQAQHTCHGHHSVGPTFQGSQEQNPPLAQSLNVGMFAAATPQPAQVRPTSSYAPGSFTRDLFEL